MAGVNVPSKGPGCSTAVDSDYTAWPNAETGGFLEDHVTKSLLTQLSSGTAILLLTTEDE